jgi:DNA-binding NarL/FixJ family response regulator
MSGAVGHLESGAKISIAVIHGFPMTRLGIRALGEAGEVFGVIGEAAEPEEGLRVIESRRPEIVVLDMRFPGRTGFDVLREARLAFPHTKIIIYCDVPGLDYPERCLRAGADGYVDMSEPIDHLVQAIQGVHRGQIYLSADRSTALLARLAREGPAAAKSPVEQLTESEYGVLHLIAQGMSNRQIAAALHRSIKTVETYRTRIKRKTGVENSTALAQFAVRQFDRTMRLAPPDVRAMPHLKTD